MASTSVKEFRGRGHAVVVAAPLRELQDSGSKVALNPKARPTSSPTEDIYQRSGSHQPVTAVHLHPFGCKEQIQTCAKENQPSTDQTCNLFSTHPQVSRLQAKNAAARQKVAHACGNARVCYICMRSSVWRVCRCVSRCRYDTPERLQTFNQRFDTHTSPAAQEDLQVRKSQRAKESFAVYNGARGSYMNGQTETV